MSVLKLSMLPSADRSTSFPRFVRRNPIVEEILVIEKRLVLKEEVRIRRVRVPEIHHEVITLREQDIVVERTKPGNTPSSLLEFAPIPRPQTPKEQLP